ncbi:MAG: DUF4372 domain-containing protein [Fidelibacterota bacterium]
MQWQSLHQVFLRQAAIDLLFAQAGSKDSLRDIETCLSVHYRKWYHIGRQGIKRKPH